MKGIFLIMVHFGDSQLTVDSLKSIRKNGTEWTVILVNNSSLRLSQEINSFPNIVLLNTPNRGFAAANNLGIKLALKKGANRVILLNNDTLIPSRSLYRLNSFADSDEKIGLVSPKIYFAPGFEFHRSKYKKKDLGHVFWYAGGIIDWKNVYPSHRGVDQVDRQQFDKIHKTDFVTGCCMLIKKEVIEKIGYLNEKYFLYYEDVEYSLLASQNGFSVKYFPGAFIYHKNAGSSGGAGSDLHQYYQTRNRLYFGLRFAPFRSKFALIKESINTLNQNGLKKRAVLDFYLQRMGRTDL